MFTTKKIVCLLLALALTVSCLALAGCNTKNEVKGIKGNSATQAETNAELPTGIATGDGASPSGQNDLDLSGAKYAAIDVKDYGVITVALYPNIAPISVQNFLGLAKQGFYDGLTFHRIMEGFMIQGGDPNGDGSGGSDTTIKGEFSANGVENKLSHKRGVLSMARSNDPNSASSQFFICHKDSDFLDGNYAAFGEVTSGMEVVDKIAADAKPTDDNGTIPKDQQPVINSIKIIE